MNHVEMQAQGPQVQTRHHTPPPAGVPDHPYRQVAVSDAPARCEMDARDRGVWHVRNTEALAEHPARMTDCRIACWLHVAGRTAHGSS